MTDIFALKEMHVAQVVEIFRVQFLVVMTCVASPRVPGNWFRNVTDSVVSLRWWEHYISQRLVANEHPSNNVVQSHE